LLSESFDGAISVLFGAELDKLLELARSLGIGYIVTNFRFTNGVDEVIEDHLEKKPFRCMFFRGTQRGIIRWIGSQASRSGQIQLQKSAIDKLDKVSQGRGIPVALRLKVDSGGCGGFTYHFDVIPAKETDQNDTIFEQGGQKVIVDDVSLSFLKDCEIDYHEEMVKSSFRVVKNAMADSSCGCGSSFSVGS
jgi:iron-sulfur cluster assembly accessory protein